MDKSDFIRISATNSMTVTSRQDSSKHEYDQKKKKDQKKESDEKSKSSVEEFETFELIEYGRLLFAKRNKELRLFMKGYMENSEVGKGNYVVTGLAPDTDEPDSTTPCPSDLEGNYILGLDTTVSNPLQLGGELSSILDPSDSGEVEEEVFAPEIVNLSKLLDQYNSFFSLVKDENRILNVDDIDFLEEIIKQKDEVLSQITVARDAVVFDYFKKLPPEDKNKIKANEILSDIHIVIDKIIRQEDENSVELQNIREKMKLDIAKQDRGAKAVSQYAQSTTKSHFIDTKK